MKFDLIPFSGAKEAWDFREEPENMRTLGVYLWRGLLILALLSVIGAAWLGLQELGAVTQADNVTPTASAPPAPLDPNKLQSQITQFSTKQQQYQTISQSPLPQIADPSK